MEIRLLAFDKRTVCSVPNIIRTTTKKFTALRLADWNVRTLTPSFSDDLLQTSDNRKTAVIYDELSRLNVNIAALQDTRLAYGGSFQG
ncbi:hypothetical protein HOLleu_05710 [Holothuria leucospilota]|uniref:Endonuclease/exonuclease/phosphatase domain-containing protein n=1 Tax=Holothuria leucospilota TaxID=206669 RepID=A0A9Q1CLH9_HOLLE|nr:hypothetical protein HOLleu_05710 [Holothuria leucospilota]